MNAKSQATIYATALYDSAESKKGKELQQVVDNFIVQLQSRHQMHMIPMVLEELQSIYFAKTDKVAVRVASKEKLDTAVLSKIKIMVKNNTDKTPEITEEIDEAMLGGVAIKYEDKLVDLTLDNQLKKLSNQLIK